MCPLTAVAAVQECANGCALARMPCVAKGWCMGVWRQGRVLPGLPAGSRTAGWGMGCSMQVGRQDGCGEWSTRTDLGQQHTRAQTWGGACTVCVGPAAPERQGRSPPACYWPFPAPLERPPSDFVPGHGPWGMPPPPSRAQETRTGTPPQRPAGWRHQASANVTASFASELCVCCHVCTP